ncbi:phosphoribosyltransferase [Pacificitalea manganoxidans]|uniref:Phosphoribosyltransferase n=1 Tax=Pacificitalea manganoxidans TaxID=1411902 RepID=A0A291LW49_9RHOB|nr:phosphoribosyltransferase [Pacificitalea manganoxidans]MAQ46327.1 phosphoribosyltransferase [Actibacterium sp.]MBF54039.1 phosphoribosyltransferase [Actibacterium sp.]MDR6308302.1 adenine/guanine phosphoribosyltransferase-like PRPP-binding protein [Pacificitalea manganoxidans]
MRTDVWQKLHRDLTPGVQADQETYAAPLDEAQLLLPIRALSDGQRGVASLIVNQASFAVLDALSAEITARLAPHEPEIIVAVPTLGLPLAEGVARRLGHERMVPLGTSRKFWYDEALSVELSSITTPSGGKRLYIDPRMRPMLQGRRVAVVDDVLSSGASMAAVLRVLTLVGVTPVAIGAAMLQGDGWRTRLATWGDIPVHGAFSTPILNRTAQGWEQP